MSKTLIPHKPVEALRRNLDGLDIKMMITLTQYYMQHSFEENLFHVKVPILLVVANKDNLALPAHGWEVSWFMPNCEAYVVDGCMHLVLMGKPGGTTW